VVHKRKVFVAYSKPIIENLQVGDLARGHYNVVRHLRDSIAMNLVYEDLHVKLPLPVLCPAIVIWISTEAERIIVKSPFPIRPIAPSIPLMS
jgi:hypothetical protein